MMRRPLILSTFLAVLLSTSNSSAEPTVQDWLKDKNKWVQYVDGLGVGLRLANIHMPGSQGHMAAFASDGRTYWISQAGANRQFLYAVDLTDPSNPVMLPPAQFG